MGLSQVDLIVTVYRGTAAYLRQAAENFKEQQPEAARGLCDRARSCLVHLYTTLDMDKGGIIADRLGRLYAYMIEQLDLAAAGGDANALEQIAALLDTIKEGWEGIKAPQPSGGEDDALEAVGAEPATAGGLVISA